jgi:hypothetical protein
MSTTSSISKISYARFYHEWKGHPISDLAKFRDITQSIRGDRPIIYFAGDSSLDNKAWVTSTGPGGNPLTVPVPEIYHQVLDKPRPKPDVAFWMNYILGERATCINTSVEESMLRDRDDNLLPHDEFIRDNMRPQDILVVSVGANDIALKPNIWTILHMLRLAWLTPRSSLMNGSAGALNYFRTLFGTKIQTYISRICAKTKPKAVVVCMIYYPLEAGQGQTGWADKQLGALGYNRWPGQLQTAIKQIYESATTKIRVEGTEVIACPLFEVLDGKRKEEYTARVEPSSEGGREMAGRFLAVLDFVLTGRRWF